MDRGGPTDFSDSPESKFPVTVLDLRLGLGLVNHFDILLNLYHIQPVFQVQKRQSSLKCSCMESIDIQIIKQNALNTLLNDACQ